MTEPAPFAPPFTVIPQPGQPQLWMLIGPPASGKSTWRDHFMSVNRTPTTIVSTDDLIDAYAAEHGLTYTEAFREIDFKTLDAEARRRFDAAVTARKNIIIDRTNMTRKSRRTWLGALPNDYYRTGVVFPLARDELDARLARRAAETGKHIPPHVVDTMIDGYEPPMEGEFDAVLKGGSLRGFPRKVTA